MRTYIIVMEAVAALLLFGLAARLVMIGRRGPRGAFGSATLGGIAACVLFGVTSLQHLIHVASRDEPWSGWGDVMLGPFAAARATVVVAAAVLAVMVGLQRWAVLGRAQTMVDVLTERLPPEAHARQSELSSRELEILGLIKRGVLSDGQIAETLHIAPATAATHVQNILKKTELHSRRDLMLLAPGRGPSAERSAERR